MARREDAALAAQAEARLVEMTGGDDGSPAWTALRRFRSKCGEHVRIAISGTSSAGKSELVNALLGVDGLRDVLPTDPGRTSVNVACLRFGRGLAPASWVEWLPAREAQQLLDDLESDPEAGSDEIERMKAALARRPLPAETSTTPVEPGKLRPYLNGEHPDWPLVRRVVVERPLEGSAWVAELDEPVDFELVDLPGHGTEVVRDRLINRRELDAIETVLFVVDKPQATGTGPIIERMRDLLLTTADRAPEQRVLPVVNKVDRFVVDAFATRADELGRLREQTTVRLDDMLLRLGLGDLCDLQKRLCPRGPAVPLLTVALDGLGPSDRVGPAERRALRDLGDIATRLPSGEARRRLLAVTLGSGAGEATMAAGDRVIDGGIGHLRRAIVAHAREHGVRALAMDRALAAKDLAAELAGLPAVRAESADQPLALVEALVREIDQLDIAAEVTRQLRPALDGWVTREVCRWPFWRTAVRRLEDGLVPVEAISDGTLAYWRPPGGATVVAPDPIGDQGDPGHAGSTTDDAERHDVGSSEESPAQRRARLAEEIQRGFLGQLAPSSPAGPRTDEVPLPRRPEELRGWYDHAYGRVLRQLIGDPAPSAELRRACGAAWHRVDRLYRQVAADRAPWEELAKVDAFARLVADVLTDETEERSGETEERPGVSRLPCNDAIGLLPWARTSTTQQGERFAQPRHLAVVAYERLTLIESLAAQLADAVHRSVRTAGLASYTLPVPGNRAPRERPSFAPVPLSGPLRVAADLEASLSSSDPAGPALRLVTDLQDFAREERDRAEL